MRSPCWTMNHATEGIGRAYPQHQGMRVGYDFGAPASVSNLSPDALPNFEPDFDTVTIHGHARLTDLLSTATIPPTGYLVSARLRDVLEQYALPPHRFFPVPATHRGKPVAGYAWLHLPGPTLKLTDSSSIEEAESAIGSSPNLSELDLLRLFRPARFAYCYVSDPLRRAVETAKITGVRFGTAKLFRSS